LPYEQGRLKFLPGPHAEDLKKELAAFRPKQSERTGHLRFEATEGEHDDITFALLLACWGLRRYARGSSEVDETLVANRGFYSMSDPLMPGHPSRGYEADPFPWR
jgi:hypothetical protein